MKTTHVFRLSGGVLMIHKTKLFMIFDAKSIKENFSIMFMYIIFECGSDNNARKKVPLQFHS